MGLPLYPLPPRSTTVESSTITVACMVGCYGRWLLSGNVVIDEQFRGVGVQPN